MKLTDRQHEILKRMAEGGVLFVRLEPSEVGMHQTCWIGPVELLPMSVNALITARLVERDQAFRRAGGLTTSYVMSVSGQAALHVS